MHSKKRNMEMREEERERKLEEQNFTKFGLNANLTVSLASALFILIFAGYALLNLEQTNRLLQWINKAVVTHFDWLFIISSNIFVLLCLYLAISKLGNVRIGGVKSKPEFSNFAWYSMLISAGMGIGLMFWAVGEPLTHFNYAPPIFEGADPAVSAMAATFFHWGLHPWGIYALIALGLAYFAFSRNLPLSMRSLFYPILKDKIYGPLGDMADTFAVLATMFGLATSLGLGAQQINSGLDHMMGIGVNTNIQVVIIVIVTLVATISIMAGIDKGVRRLSQITIILAGVFMILVFLLGPTGYILRLFSNSLGEYFGNIIQNASYVAAGEGSTWQGEWTIFYLAWWISWSPFVGMFIARISKGRTVREIILGVLIVPSLLSFFWLTVFGGSAIAIDGQAGGVIFETVQNNYPVALYELIDLIKMPFLEPIMRIGMLILATGLVVAYFVTSSDSGSLVVDKLTSGGALNTPKHQRLFWALMEGLLAATLLLIGGELALMALQTAVISTGLPLSLILLLMGGALIKGIRKTYAEQKRGQSIDTSEN
jgi:choline/glycine/proline betaine transport protein/BCCT family betaine/carnitine transporter